ncbi:MAG: hypothetical protein IPK19_03805 [Chloroflexi bacterium]|nr:hypothetical protein [Chloroflexota bacterium]
MNRVKLFLLMLLALTLVVGISPTGAQEEVVSTSIYTPVITLPPQARLEGLRPVYQQTNRCSAAALTIQLSYFGWTGTYDDTIRALNPHAEDVAVRLDEMLAFGEAQGLKGIERVGGTLELIKALVANGFPVLMESVYYDGPDAFKDWMSHNRVVMGYDDAQGVLLTYDSLLGNGENNSGRPVPYADVDTRWRAFNRDYLVLYRPEDEAKLQAILGPLWDARAAAEQALAQSIAELDTPAADSFTLFNIGASLVLLERYEEAADYFDRARGTGLPWRMMWYMYGPFEAYYHTGRYQDVLQLARDVIATTPGVEETYYYAGLAYEALGEPARAKSNYEVAVMRNNGYAPAVAALSRLATSGG